jgi:hypothetical protein
MTDLASSLRDLAAELHRIADSIDAPTTASPAKARWQADDRAVLMAHKDGHSWPVC